MNLVNFDLKELSLGELEETNGGAACSNSIFGICVCGFASSVSTAISDFASGFKEGFNQGAADGAKK